MTSKNRTLLAVALFIPLAAILLATFACLPAPVGDPEQSKVDETLVGAYRGVPANEEDKSPVLAILRPWDAHTYLLEYYIVNSKDGKEERQISHFKAWLTTLGGKTFITAEPKDDFKFLGDSGEKPFWVVMRLDKVATGLEARLVNVDSEFVKGLTKREELEAAIKAHASDQSLYVEKPIVFKKLGKEDQAFIDDVLTKFSSHK